MGGKKGEQEEKRKGYLWLACKINEKELKNKKLTQETACPRNTKEYTHTAV